MSLEHVNLEHLPAEYNVHIAFFRNVRNASLLHQQLLGRNTDFEYAFIDASVVISRLHVLSAVFKATQQAAKGALKTPNLHSEIVSSLSPSSNIADAYRRYGISLATKDLIVVKVTFPTETEPRPRSSEEIWNHLEQNVEGEVQALSDENLTAVTDLSKLRKYFKLNGLKWLDDIKDATVKRKETEMLILGGMALRGV